MTGVQAATLKTALWSSVDGKMRLFHEVSGKAALLLEVDEGVGLGSQLPDGHAPPALDIVCHGRHLLARNVDELAAVVHHTCDAAFLLQRLHPADCILQADRSSSVELQRKYPGRIGGTMGFHKIALSAASNNLARHVQSVSGERRCKELPGLAGQILMPGPPDGRSSAQ